MQQNWIGKSEGAEITFKTAESDIDIKVYTTRPDTVFGSTYLVLSPENGILNKIVTDENKNKVEEYCNQAKLKNELLNKFYKNK